MPTAEDIVRVANGEVGYIETPNNKTKYGKWYGMDGVPWCDIFVSWVFEQNGALHLCPGKNAYTPAHASKFQKAGRWGSEPRMGAVVFFRFPGGPPRIHHVGIVMGWGNGWIETIEGNTSRGTGGSQRDGGGVWRRRRSVGIVGYGYPAYDAAPTPHAPPPQTPGKPAFPGTMKLGSRGDGVRALQRRLNDHSPPDRDISVDGDFGKLTETRVRQFQASKRLTVDGVVGPQTWKALW